MFSQEKHIKQIIKAIKKSSSLQSMHFNHAPIIWKSGKLLNYIVKKLNAVIENKKKFKKPQVHLMYKNDWKEQIRLILQKNIGEKELEQYQGLRIDSEEGISQNTYFILTRILGHPEMKGADQWAINKECYMCGRYTYTLFFHYKEGVPAHMPSLKTEAPSMPLAGMFGKKQLTMKPNVVVEYQQPVELDIKIKGSYESVMKDKSKRMINILEFCQAIDPDYKSPESFFEDHLEVLDDKQREILQTNQTQKEQKMSQIKRDIRERYIAIWKAVYKKNLRWKKPQTLPSSIKPEQCDENLYIFADFVKPTNLTEQVSIGVNQQILFFPTVRKEEFKPLPYQKQEVEYRENYANVFQDWKVDTDDTHKVMLENDLKHWKVHKFIKDPEDIKKLEDVLYRHIKDLKEIYISLISDSNFPFLTWLDFGNFVKTINIIDEKMPLSAIDRHYIVTNVEEETLLENPDRALCRYEFFEVFVRIAGQKYKDSKICETYAEAFEKLLKEHLIKHSNRFPWQEFRDEELWVRDVNLVFDANLEGLQRVYKKYFQHKQQYMSLQDAINLITRDTEINMTYKDATLSYGLSKMTVKNEMEKAYNPYKRLAFVEFLEFLGRVAQEKYKSSSQPLYIKIEKILDEVLAVVKVARKEIQRKVEIPKDESEESVNEDELPERQKTEEHHFVYESDNKFLARTDSEVLFE